MYIVSRYYEPFDRLPIDTQVELLLSMIDDGGCYYLHCPNCPVYTTHLTCSVEYVKGSSIKIFLNLFGSDKLFEHLLEKLCG